MSARGLLIYEGDCGFCNRCARFISRRMPSRAELKPWQRVDLDAYGISRARARYEVLWVAPDGQSYAFQRNIDGSWHILADGAAGLRDVSAGLGGNSVEPTWR